MVVYKTIELVSTSEKHWGDALKKGYEEAKKTLRGIRNIQTVRFDVKVKDEEMNHHSAEGRIPHIPHIPLLEPRVARDCDCHHTPPCSNHVPTMLLDDDFMSYKGVVCEVPLLPIR